MWWERHSVRISNSVDDLCIFGLENKVIWLQIIEVQIEKKILKQRSRKSRKIKHATENISQRVNVPEVHHFREQSIKSVHFPLTSFIIKCVRNIYSNQQFITIKRSLKQQQILFSVPLSPFQQNYVHDWYEHRHTMRVDRIGGHQVWATDLKRVDAELSSRLAHWLAACLEKTLSSFKSVTSARLRDTRDIS